MLSTPSVVGHDDDMGYDDEFIEVIHYRPAIEDEKEALLLATRYRSIIYLGSVSPSPLYGVRRGGSQST